MEAQLRFCLALLAAVAILAVRPAFAQSPVGEWLVADGDAHVRLVDCGGSLWGVVSWEKSPGRDENNPDASKRNRPTLGMPVLIRMRGGSDSGVWKGKVYNAENGRMYDASIKLSSPTVLHVEGCALGFLCGGEDWHKASPKSTAIANKSAQDICSQL
jgi:uncharacterized protein (DUF2147 family)